MKNNKKQDNPVPSLDKELLKKAFEAGEANIVSFKDFYKSLQNGVETNKEQSKYTKEDMKQFGLYLGNNLKKLKQRKIDDIFEEYIG